MNFRAFGRVNIQDDFLVWRDFARAYFAAKNNIAVGKHRGIAEFFQGAIGVFDGNGICPNHLAVAHEENCLVRFAMIPFAGIEKRMLRESFPQQDGRRMGNRVGRGEGGAGAKERVSTR